MNILLTGFMHPLLGIDHIIMMIAVGAWAIQLGGKARWIVPAAFVTIMTLGGIIGMETGSLAYIEAGIIASVIAIGVLIAMAVRLPVVASAALVGVFAFFHGHAHGSEMLVGMSGIQYVIGFIDGEGSFSVSINKHPTLKSGIEVKNASLETARIRENRSSGGVRQ